MLDAALSPKEVQRDAGPQKDEVLGLPNHERAINLITPLQDAPFQFIISCLNCMLLMSPLILYFCNLMLIRMAPGE